jgi:DNA polymerase III delta prime subunit
MTATYALFFETDHRNVVVESWRVALPNGKSASRLQDDVGKALQDLQGRGKDISFAGVFEADEDGYLDVAQIYDLVCSCEDGAESAIYCRYARRSGDRAHAPKSSALKKLTGKTRLNAASAGPWYASQAEIPARIRSSFAPYTLVYLDRRDQSVESMPVHLFSNLDTAVSAMITSNDWWEPIALFKGNSSPSESGAFLKQRDRQAPFQQKADNGGRLPPAPLDDGSVDESGEPGGRIAADINVADVIARVLVTAGIQSYANKDAGKFREAAGQDRAQTLRAFREIVLSARPLILLETVHSELSFNIARFLADIGNLKYRSEGRFAETPPAEGRLREGKGSVVLFSKRSFEGGGQDQSKEVDNRIRALLAAGDVGLVVTDNIAALPGALRLNRDLEIFLPDLVGGVRDSIFGEIFGEGAAAGASADVWTRYASALDLEKIYHAGARGVQAIADLEERVQGRLTRLGAAKGPTMAQIHGLGQAKEQAATFISDIQAYLSGSIPWTQVDRGMLLIGPPGTGKTMLARAMSREANVRFIHASAADWQSANHLGEHVQSIRSSFSLARRYAPSILFIDEFDSIGRRGHGGNNEFYHTAIVNAVLEELQGFQDREGVVVIAATNRLEGIDPALRRAGRLDRLVGVNYPNIDALTKIYEYYIHEQTMLGVDVGKLDLRELARMTFGQTGADVEVYVRGAARRARNRVADRGKTVIAQEDFVAEIMGAPSAESGAARLSDKDMRRTAVHEAGHALLQLSGPTKGRDISYVSVIPRSDGTLGFVFSAPEARHIVTKNELLEDVRVLLGGRAAESVIFGEGNISSGSGGASPASDLAQATRILTAMMTQYGFSRRRRLLWSDKDADADDVQREVRRTLDRLYRQTVRRVSRNKRLLRRIVKVLQKHQEVTGAQLRAMIGRK